MMLTIALCAILCVVVCGYVLKPLPTPRAFMALSLLAAVASLGIYMWLGNPEIPARPHKTDPQVASDMRLESTLMDTLEKNPDDENALVRLAALRTVQGRTGDQTMKLLDHAERLNPHDKRIKIIRTMIVPSN